MPVSLSGLAASLVVLSENIALYILVIYIVPHSYKHPYFIAKERISPHTDKFKPLTAISMNKDTIF
jgi:hypothetical protein